jgi:urease accessory protein
MLSALLLADGRFPSGAHAHSVGLESAVAAGLVRDLDDLQAWITGALHASWRVDAAVAVAAFRLGRRAAPLPDWAELDAEALARVTSPQLRTAGRALGRQLLRAGAAAWPSPVLRTVAMVHPDGPLVAVAHGAVAAAADLGLDEVAPVMLHSAALGATTAAVRLLGLDPYAVLGVIARLAPALAEVADAAETPSAPAGLAAGGTPLLDLLLHDHATTEVRFFAT